MVVGMEWMGFGKFCMWWRGNEEVKESSLISSLSHCRNSAVIHRNRAAMKRSGIFFIGTRGEMGVWVICQSCAAYFK